MNQNIKEGIFNFGGYMFSFEQKICVQIIDILVENNHSNGELVRVMRQLLHDPFDGLTLHRNIL
jgi:hypothetical protein